MTWLRPLDDLQATHLPEVGYKAYCLGRLSQRQLPVATGQVITARAWQTLMADLAEQSDWAGQADLTSALGDRKVSMTAGAGESLPLAALHTLDIRAFQTLQRSSQQAQRQMQATALPSALQAALPPWPHPTWMLRSSLWLEPRTQGSHPFASAMTGLLPAQVGSPLSGTLAQALRQFWGQALTARSLVLWQRYGQPLPHLGLATLVMPIYPALATGTLTLGQGKAAVKAVVGLGLPLSRGEAIPARCHLAVNDPETAEWTLGFQEQVYHLAVDPETTTPPGLPLRITPRDQADLPPPLTPEQLHQLLQLGHQAQAILAEELPLPTGWRPAGLHLEWLLCPIEADGWEFIITQATPQIEPIVAQAAMPVVASVKKRPLPSLPSLSTVVRGIGASTGQVQGVAVVATQAQDLPRPLPAQAIVVLPDLQPDVFLQLEAVAGIVTERGGATCHAAILAREIGVPAVVGAPQATELLDGETHLWLDGDRGVVYGLAPETASALNAQTVPPPLVMPPTADPSWTIQTDRYRTLRTKVMANLSQTRRLSTLPLDHIAGIGLLRSEWLLLDILDGRHPWHWVNQGQEAELQSRLVQQLEMVLQALGPNKPLRYRSLDLRSHEWQALEGSPPPEPNPMLGLRGTLSYDVDARLFQVELAALATLQRLGYSNLQLILPFVRTVEEVLTCRQYVRQAGLIEVEDFALWIMAEVPSVLFSLPAYAQAGIHGIAIGSNDLTQLLLAVDRDQPTLASAYDERHPVVQQAIAYLIREAHRNGLVCSICGQAPVRYPDLIANLVNWGINSISVEAAAVPFTLEAVWQAEQNRAK